MTSFKHRRKIYLINPRFQYSFIIFASTIGLVSLCIFYFAILYFFWSFEQRGISLGIPAKHIFFRYIDEQRHSMNVIFSIAAVLVLITTSISALILSHKVAGPIHRLKEHLKDVITQQTLRPVKFRKGDFFIELEESFNTFVENADKLKNTGKNRE